ncbi:uncharacterized protein LOC144470614 isoform X2 [Augochlora pura]
MSDQRNYKLLEALDSVDNSLALMTARTERLNILRKHYEAYLRRMCTIHADGVSDMSSRKSDKYLQTDAKVQMSPEARSTLLLKSPQPNYQTIRSTICSPSETIKTPSRQRTTYDPNTLQMYWKNDIQQLPKIRLSLPSESKGFQQSQKIHSNNNLHLDPSDSPDESKLQNADRFDRFFAQGQLNLDATKFPYLPSVSQYPIDPSQRTQSFRLNPSNNYPNNNDSFPYLRTAYQRNEYDPSCRNKQVRMEENKEKVSMTTSSEFDEYLDKIRKLHRDLDIQSSDEDGIRDDLHTTASHDDSQISAKESFDKNFTSDVKKVLELAENLVSRTKYASNAKNVEKEEENQQSCVLMAKKNHVEISDAQQGRASLMAHATDKISNDIALYRPELDSHANIEKPKNPSYQGVDDPFDPRQEHSVHPSHGDDKIYVAEESKLEQFRFSVSEALEPWDLVSFEKQIKQIDFEEETVPNESDTSQIEQEVVAHETVQEQEQEQEQEVIFNNIDDTLELQDNEYVGDQHEGSKTENQYDEVSAPLQESEIENIQSQDDNDKILEQKDFDDYDDYNDNNQEKSDAMDNVFEAENSEKPNGKEISNENYDYDQNQTYEYEKKEEYDGYGIQEYPQEPSEQYEGYTSEQYDQYIGHPESSYDNQPDAQYQEDTNQKYAYPYNEQYEENQEFATNANEHYEPNVTEIQQKHEHELKTELNVPEEEFVEQLKESQSEERKEMEETEEKEKAEETEKTVEKEKKEEKEEQKKEEEKEEQKKKEDSMETASSKEEQSEILLSQNNQKKKKDVIKSLLDSDTDSTIEQNVSNTESDFDFN